MVVRSDSDNPPPTSAAEDHRHSSELTLNDPTTSVAPGALTQTQRPRADVPWPAARTGGSWMWSWRSLKASWETHLLRRAHDEPATMASIRSLETHLASLTTLSDVCARIDRRLARADAVGAPGEGATIDAALRDVCAQIHDRLIRVEAAIQRTEGFVADKPWDVGTIAYRRLERVEETLRLTQKSLADSTLPELCVNIQRQLTETRVALERTERAVADNTLRDLYDDVDARLTRTEDTLRRTQGILAEWLKELSASMTGRFAEAEDTIQRIERIVSSRTVEQTSPQQPSGRMDRRSHATTVRLLWMRRLAVPVSVLVTAVAIGVLIKTSRGAAPEKVVSLAPTTQISTPVAAATTERVATPAAESVTPQLRASSTPALTANAPPSTSRNRGSAPRRLESAPAVSRPQTFVGTLSITSVPPGASVSINGKAAGVTPLRLPRQRAGSMAVQIAQDGFERWSAAVRVPADQLTEVSARLRPIVQ
jgi:ElaB/YqjD/DUF883 family membrane-anchored ribosome-binding protein